MAGPSTSASLYLASVTLDTTSISEPVDAKEKPHHLKNDSGFRNPWDSWRDIPPIKFAGFLFGWVKPLAIYYMNFSHVKSF
jgi:hypothetical protein